MEGNSPGGRGPLKTAQTDDGVGRSQFGSWAALTHCRGCSLSPVSFSVKWMLTILTSLEDEINAHQERSFSTAPGK